MKKKETNLPKALMADLDYFISRNYIKNDLVKTFANAFSMLRTDQLMREMHDEPFEPDKGFTEYVNRMINKKEIIGIDVCQGAGLDSREFFRIRNDRNHLPDKRTAVALAVGLRLDYDEAQEFLGKAGYTLSRSKLPDVIVEYFIRENIYDLDRINEALRYYDERTLGSTTMKTSP